MGGALRKYSCMKNQPPAGAATGFWVGWGTKDFEVPQQKLANRLGARGSGGALTWHCYFLTNKDNLKTDWEVAIGNLILNDKFDLLQWLVDFMLIYALDQC